MAVNLQVPEVGESITSVQIGAWRKSEGDAVKADEVLVELETDKAAVELPAPVGGTLARIVLPQGSAAAVGDVIGVIDEQGAAAAAPSPSKPASGARASGAPAPEQPGPAPAAARAAPARRLSPSARRARREAGLPASTASGAGPTVSVPQAAPKPAVEPEQAAPAVAPEQAAPAVAPEQAAPAVAPEQAAPAVEPEQVAPPPATAPSPAAIEHREEERVPMTHLRKVIAGNLVKAQHAAALLTTFNDIDMTAVNELRARYKDAFLERHGIKLGFMSFFVKAAVDALQTVPAVNARIDGTDIVYRKYQDIGIAVGGGRGLLVPVLRNAESMSLAAVELAVADFGARARENKIGLAELQGGTFTITNGGIYGSLLSTPIVNPPQSGILGMHAIQDRPVAIDSQVVVRPMMYVALTYDHRIVDGREAVTFLRRIKDLVECPERLWLQL